MNVPGIARCALLSSVTIQAQMLIPGMSPGGQRQLFFSDAAVLESQEKRTSLPCDVKRSEAKLGFDLGFHTGYQVLLRLRDLVGEGDTLTVIFRVTPTDPTGRTPQYFHQQWKVPPIADDGDGEVHLEGAFTIGAGDYKVDWLMRDGRERICSAYWKLSARLPESKKGVSAALAPGSVLSDIGELVYVNDSASESTEEGLPVTIFVNVGSQRRGAAALLQSEKHALVSILRAISREPRISRFSVIAFNLDQSKVVFQQTNVRHIDFASLNNAISSFGMGTVAIDQLAATDAQSHFLAHVARDIPTRSRSESIIFLSPRIAYDHGLNDSVLEKLGHPACPVVYLSYDLMTGVERGHDLIGSAVKRWKGSEFYIAKPADLLSVWPKIMSRIVESVGTSWQSASTSR